MRLPIGRYSTAILLVLTIALLSLPTTGIAQTPTTSPSTPTEGTQEPSDGGPAPRVKNAVDSLAARTPIPTPDPGYVQRQVADFTESVGWSDITFLGLSAEDWINFALSTPLFLLAYWAALWFLAHILRRLILRTETKFDDEFFASIERELKWLMGVLLLRVAFLRLAFFPGSFRTAFNDILFVVTLVLLIRIAVKLIDFGLDWYETYLDSKKQPDGIEIQTKLLTLIVAGTGPDVYWAHSYTNAGQAKHDIQMVLDDFIANDADVGNDKFLAAAWKDFNIIGIPFAKQHIKLIPISLFPFGRSLE